MNENEGNTNGPSEPAPSRLSGTVVSLGLVSLFADISSEMIYPQIPIFLTSVLGAPAWALGLIEGIAESTASLLKVVSGWLSDRSGRRKPLTVAGYTIGMLPKMLMAFATGWPAVLLLRFTDRLGKGLRTSPRDALIAEAAPPKLRGRAYGLHRTMDTTGAVLGPLLGAWFLSHVSPDLRKLFLFAGIPGLIAILILLLLVREKPADIERRRAEAGERPPLPRWKDLSPEYRQFLLAIIVFGLGNSSDTFLILRAGQIGVRPEYIMVLYATFNIVEVLFGYLAGRLSDRIGRRPLIIAGYLVFTAVYLGFALTRNIAMVWVLFMLYGGYYALTQGVQRAFAADMADPKQRATQVGAYHTVVGMATLPASIVAGLLYQVHPAAPFVWGAALALAGALLLTRSRPKIEQAA